VVFDGMLADTAARPAWRFCLVIVKSIERRLLDRCEGDRGGPVLHDA
jgi:hypothetical protein